ncbi:hypothetical protein DUNSADRAFT_11217 [Dunaliella salina]|nr:hypothetical protein DUNSADRAFT_11217 [Dunaliella salina]|eukprot:KAF5832781.1 hypothetical protein DUNSADRAFT_11217 [Dunaliella salina]
MANQESWGGLAHCHAVTALEVLQRLDVQELGAFGHCILGALRPKCLILTTPNWEYNKVMRAAMAIRRTPTASPSENLEAGEGGSQGWGSTFHFPTNAIKTVQPKPGAPEQPGPSTQPASATASDQPGPPARPAFAIASQQPGPSTQPAFANASELPGSPTQPAFASAQPEDVSSQAAAPAAFNATQAPASGVAAPGAARSMATRGDTGAVGQVGGAIAVDGGPSWPGPAGRDGLPLRHADHRFEWTRQEFRSWAQDLAKRFGYEVRFQDMGHVLNEAQVLQAMPPMDKQREGGFEPQGAAALPEVDVQLTSSEAEAPSAGNPGASDKLSGLTAEGLGQEQFQGRSNVNGKHGAGGGGMEAPPGYGGATQMAVFTAKDGAAPFGMPAGKLKDMLQQTACVGLLSKVLLLTSEPGPAQAETGPVPSPLQGSQNANTAGQTAFDNISVAGSNQEDI